MYVYIVYVPILMTLSRPFGLKSMVSLVTVYIHIVQLLFIASSSVIPNGAGLSDKVD